VTTNTNDPILLKLHAARVLASDKQPYLSTAMFAMVPVRVEGLGTFASDAKWRLYYDPQWLTDLPVEEVAGLLLHEVGHCIRGHADRFQSMGENARFARLYNIAGDSLINADLREDSIRLPENGVYIESLVEQGLAVTRDMSAEQIYHLLREKAEENCTCDESSKSKRQGDEQGEGSGDGSGDEQGDEQGDGSGEGQGEGSGDEQGDGSGNGQGEGSGEGQGEGSGKGSCPLHGEQQGGWDCGSAADGVRRQYEAEGEAIDEGIDEDRADLIRQQVAVEIRNHVRNQGSVPGGYERWAKEVLEPVVDWRKELASLVRRTYAQVAGLRDYTYKRPSRRQAAMRDSGQGIVLPAMRQPNPPKVSIVIDTSGSMSDDMLAWALSETQGVLRSLGSSGRQVRVISCDAAATTQRVTSIAQVELKGGGGTDMRVGIEEAMSGREKPDAVLVISDGYTAWPSEPLKGATLIVALTDEAAAANVPAWARTVVVTR
jgi:predicted metal-dependent peptidase